MRSSVKWRSWASALLATALAAFVAGCGDRDEAMSPLTGAWRSSIQFSSGPYAEVSDLEFMLVFHSDGTMTESSNYDAAPPVPPAYGTWRAGAPGTFEAHYEFYVTQAADPGGEPAQGWLPAGRGTVDETITLSPDGMSYTSVMHVRLVDAEDAPLDDLGEAQARGTRIGFAPPREDAD